MKNINLLILDDKEENSINLQSLLAEFEDINIIHSTNPNEALKTCLEKDISIVLVSVQMRGMDSFEFISLLKTDPKTSHIRIILITDNHKEDKYLIRGIQNGAVDYLQKPFITEIITAKIRFFIQEIHTQKELLKKNEELELSNKALIQAHKDAEDARKSKDIFLANMSHEIRTPINGIVGIVHMLKSADLNSEYQDWINRLEMASDSLLLIINDILDISKIDSGKLKIEFEEFNLENLLLETGKLFRTKALEKQIDFKVNLDPSLPKHVKFDSLRLQQIISNFISNSIKFTDKGEIILSATNLGYRDNYAKIKFSVKDSGIGIKPEAVEKIFQAFEQGEDAITKKIGGTGLGLAIVKRLAELLNGTVCAESDYGHGSQFSFIVEIEEIFTAEDSKSHQNLLYNQLPKLTGLKILIAEDNDLNSFMLSHMLKTWNCEVNIVKNGRLALEAIDQSPYDLILMDTHMPIMSGFEAIKQIRTNYKEHLRKIPIITISASVLEHEQKAAFEVGADEVIGKPFNPIELYNKIVKVCDLSLYDSSKPIA